MSAKVAKKAERDNSPTRNFEPGNRYYGKKLLVSRGIKSRMAHSKHVLYPG